MDEDTGQEEKAWLFLMLQRRRKRQKLKKKCKKPAFWVRGISVKGNNSESIVD